jgi:hypothetical protein
VIVGGDLTLRIEDEAGAGASHRHPTARTEAEGHALERLTDAAERSNSPAVAAAIDPAAQSVIYASVDDPLIGEELFAAGAYSNAGTAHQASLQVQDILRWAIILVLLAGSALKLIGMI